MTDLSLPALLAFVRDQGIAADMTAAFHIVSDPDASKAAKAESDAVLFAAIAERLTTLDAQAQAITVNLRAAEVALTDARLAVNDWHACETQDELTRWRIAQEYLIVCAKDVARAELQQRAEHAEAQRAALLTALKAITDDYALLCGDGMTAATEPALLSQAYAAIAATANPAPPATPDEARTLAATLQNGLAVERTQDAWTPSKAEGRS